MSTAAHWATPPDDTDGSLAPQPNLSDVDVGVVIVTYNHAEEARALIESLPAACEGLTWDVVVVDNDSSDDTVSVLQGCGVTVLSMGRNAGYSAALNVGIAHFPNTRSILVSNPDLTLYTGSIAPTFAALEDVRVGIVSPQLRSMDGELGVTQRRTSTLLRSIGMTFLGSWIANQRPSLSDVITDPQDYLHPKDLDWAVGALMLVSRHCLELVGPWDESFFLYSEETDFCERVTAAGLAIRYIPVAAGSHTGGGGVHEPKLRSMMAVNRVRLYARHHSALSSYVFFALAIVFEGSRAASGNKAAWQAFNALVRPSKRPMEIQCSGSFLPR